MNETLPLLLAGVAGLLLGAIFFGGLWWTVRKGLSSKQPALWSFGSMLLRMAIVLAGFYFVGRGNWSASVTPASAASRVLNHLRNIGGAWRARR